MKKKKRLRPQGLELKTPRLACVHLLHCATSRSDVLIVKHIHYIAFDKNAGLLEQQAYVKRVARKSYESMAGSSSSFI